MGPPSTWQSTPETQESSLTPPSPLLLNLQLDSSAQIFLQSFHFLHLHYHHPSPSHYYLLPGLFYSVFFLNHPCPSQFHSPDSKHNELSKMPVCHVRLYKILRWLPTAWKSWGPPWYDLCLPFSPWAFSKPYFECYLVSSYSFFRFHLNITYKGRPLQLGYSSQLYPITENIFVLHLLPARP